MTPNEPGLSCLMRPKASSLVLRPIHPLLVHLAHQQPIHPLHAHLARHPARHPVPHPALSTCMNCRLPTTLHIFMTAVWGAMVLLLLLNQMTLHPTPARLTKSLLISRSNPHFRLGSSNES